MEGAKGEPVLRIVRRDVRVVGFGVAAEERGCRSACSRTERYLALVPK